MGVALIINWCGVELASAAFISQSQPLLNAKAVLFVYDHQAQPVEFHLLLEQRVRADSKHGVTPGNIGEHDFPLLLFLIA